MSIQSEIALLQNTKADLRNAIMEKGVVVTVNDPFAIYPTKISQISLTAGDRDALFTDILERDITSIDIPEGTSKIDEDVFRYCTQMTTVTIPSTVTSIGYQAFEFCTALTSITCLATTPPTIYSGSFDSTNDCPIYVPAASVTAYQTAWPQYASRIQALPDYTLFNSLVDRSISGDYTIPSDVITIGDYAFAYCTNLTSITIPNTVETIGSRAFIGCSGLTSVVIGSGVMSILGYTTFGSCTSLTSITCLATTPPTMDSTTFNNTNNCPIYVPAASVETYKAASGWRTYSSRIQAIPS